MPERIQLRRTKGWRMPADTVKVDRSTPFGNPFPISKGTARSMGITKPIWQVGTWEGPAMWFKDTKEEAPALSVQAFRAWLDQPPQGLLRAKGRLALRGKNIGCWCALGQPCHGDVWLECVNA